MVCAVMGLEVLVMVVRHAAPEHGQESPLVPETVQRETLEALKDTVVVSPVRTSVGMTLRVAVGGEGGMQASAEHVQPGLQGVSTPVQELRTLLPTQVKEGMQASMTHWVPFQCWPMGQLSGMHCVPFQCWPAGQLSGTHCVPFQC